MKKVKRAPVIGGATILVLAIALTACGGSGHDDHKPHVVASTDVWGNVTQAVAGGDAQVDSVIKDPSIDPHSFDPSAANMAAVSDADLVVYNGGGYDPFINKVLDAHPEKRQINAFDARVTPAEKNEHVWYDIPTVAKVATQIADQLGQADAAHAKDYHDRAAAFSNKLQAITTITARIATQHPKSPVTQTEPIAHYLLLAAGADDRTPHEFEEAIEQGTDPSPTAVAAARDLLTAKKVRVLMYNSQTSDKVALNIEATAKESGVKVVEVTETLPAGLDYIQWQTRNAQSLAAALE